MEEKDSKKEKKIKKTDVMRFLPGDTDSWILQPTGVTVMRYNYDVTQTKILVTIVQRLQDAIKAAINKESEEKQLDLFSKHRFDETVVHEDEVLIHMKINEFGVDKRKYKELKEAMTNLAQQVVWIPVKDKDGRKFEKAGSLFEPIIPTEKYNKDVYIKMSRVNALRFINVELGYHRYLKEVVFETRNKYVQRIYMYIRSWINVNRTPVIKIDDFRAMLQLEEKYPRWSMFYSKVIEPAEKELKEKAESGQVDCYFTVEKLYKKGSLKRGEPEALQFTILKGSVEMEPENEVVETTHLKELEKLLRSEFGFRGSLAALLNKIGEDRAAMIMAKVPEWKTYIGEHDVKNPAGFVTQCITNLIDEPEHEQLPKQTDSDAASVSADAARPSETETQRPAVDVALVEQFKNALHARSNEQEWSTWLSFIGLADVHTKGNSTGSVTLSFPSPFFQEQMQSQFKDVIMQAVGEVFGDVQVNSIVVSR